MQKSVEKIQIQLHVSYKFKLFKNVWPFRPTFSACGLNARTPYTVDGPDRYPNATKVFWEFPRTGVYAFSVNRYAPSHTLAGCNSMWFLLLSFC